MVIQNREIIRDSTIHSHAGKRKSCFLLGGPTITVIGHIMLKGPIQHPKIYS
jgi:hypothetical protein